MNGSSESCPSPTAVSSWLDGEIGGAESHRIGSHLEHCTACREQMVGWVDAVRAGQQPVVPVPAPRAECPDAEALVAYTERQLAAHEASGVEQHLWQCECCVREVQRLIRLRVAMGEPAVGQDLAAQPAMSRDRAPLAGNWQLVLVRIRDGALAIPRALARPIPVASFLATAAMLLIALARLMPGTGDGGDARYRGDRVKQQFQVVVDTATAHARPGEDQPVIATLAHGTKVRWLEQVDEWTRVELADGQRVWMHSGQLAGGSDDPR